LKEGKLSESEGGSEEDLAGFETGLEAKRTCAGEQEVQRGVWCRNKKRTGHRKFLPFTSVLTEII
jgi:hypothetical protein